MRKCTFLILLVLGWESVVHGEDLDFWEDLWFQHARMQLTSPTSNNMEEVRIASNSRETPSFTELTESYEWHYLERKDLSIQCALYTQRLESERAFLDDPELMDYLYGRLLDIFPGSLPHGHPGELKIRVLKDPTPNAFAMSDGTIILNSGMLTFVHDEQELEGVIAHEVAHIVMDHNLENSLGNTSRQVFADLLSGITAGVVSYNLAREGYSSTNSAIVGAYAGVSVGLLTNEVLGIIGASYSRKQEMEADAAAHGWIKSTGRDPRSFIRLLARLDEYGRVNGISAKASLADDHPGVRERILALGDTQPVLPEELSTTNPGYDRKVSPVLTLNGLQYIGQLEYAKAGTLLDRAIASGWYSSRTLVSKAMIKRLYAKDDREVQEAITLCERAIKRTSDFDPWTWAELGLSLLKLRNMQAALTAFENCHTELLPLEKERASQLIWVQEMVSKIKSELE